MAGELLQHFEAIVAILRQMDFVGLWEAANDAERRVLVDELVQAVTVFPDHLEVTVGGLPALNVTLEEVGLKSQNARVGGAFDPAGTPAVLRGEIHLGAA